jgi:hypothetical protein
MAIILAVTDEAKIIREKLYMSEMKGRKILISAQV